MPTGRMEASQRARLVELEQAGARKAGEAVIDEIRPAESPFGPRYLLVGEGQRRFLRMNSNGYLGMAMRPELITAEEAAIQKFGTGPQAVRFISGTYAPHVELEEKLARFHDREAGMIFSSAYATVMGLLPPLITPETAVISDALNHNCIINAIRLSRPAQRHVYPHLDLELLEQALQKAAGACARAIVVTDGVFSMRGDCAPLDKIQRLVATWDERFPENALLVVDDSHGVGALGATGRGSEEITGGHADLLVATLGKALGVNGGYVVGPRATVEFLRETSPFYVYSNPITPGEAAAAIASLDLLDGPAGRELLARLRAVTAQFRAGLEKLGLETLPGEHPVVPLLVRDTARAAALASHLRARGVLATPIVFPVVPHGEEEIRFQLSAEHTPADIDYALEALAAFRGTD